MTKYDFLCSLQQQGLLQTHTKEYGLPSYSKWMEYYEFYLAHPNLSYSEISFYFQASRATIYRAIRFMGGSSLGCRFKKVKRIYQRKVVSLHRILEKESDKSIRRSRSFELSKESDKRKNQRKL